MATLTHARPNACIVRPHQHGAGWLTRPFAAVRAWYVRRRAYARTMADLAQLDPRDLHDLGVHRYDFDAIARGTYRR